MVFLDTVLLQMGVLALHELGMKGAGARLGVVDARACDPRHEEYIEESLAIRPRGRVREGKRTHADDMLDLVRETAPEARVVLAEVAETDGLVFRKSVAEGILALEGRGLGVVLASLEFRRVPERCSPESPCEPCLAARRMAGLAVMVIAAGNRGELGYTCPAAGAGSEAYVVVATDGPRDSGAVEREGQSGTSVSAAVLAGGVALLQGAIPDLGRDELREALWATATQKRGMVGFHFYRAFGHILHVREGGVADGEEAQRIVNDNLDVLQDAGCGASDGVAALDVLEQALRFAPWSAELRGRRARLLARAQSAAGFVEILEAIRLQWDKGWLHRVLADFLDAFHQPGGDVERLVADLLDSGDVGGAQRAMREGQMRLGR